MRRTLGDDDRPVPRPSSHTDRRQRAEQTLVVRLGRLAPGTHAGTTAGTTRRAGTAARRFQPQTARAQTVGRGHFAQHGIGLLAAAEGAVEILPVRRIRAIELDALDLRRTAAAQ